MLTRKLAGMILLLFLLPALNYAQVTTGFASGVVKTPEGAGLEGASVTLVHQPSGSRYMNTTRKGGYFNMQGLRVGGPYSLTVQYVGFKNQQIDNITITLSEPYDITITMTNENASLLEVLVNTVKKKAITEKSGASTIIDSRQLQTLPSFSRSITDFTKLTPQSNGGSSFAGRSGYYNNLKVDGANLNNNFGLSTDPLPGGGAEPISLDAFDEISVNIAPVDVRQTGFTGAGINAVTKSGTNEFHGSAFTFYRDQSFNGRRSGDNVLPPAATASSKQSIGATIGGPIIRNKLFFFVNGEYEVNSGAKFSTLVPLGSKVVGSASSTPIDSLAKLSTYLKDKYGYDAGVYDDYPSAKRSNYKYMVKIDWNINNHHKLTAKYNDFVSNEEPSSINGTSIIGGGGFALPGTTSQLSSLPNSRLSNRSLVFANSVYGFKHIVRSATLELNSNYRNISNSFLATMSRVRDTRITNSSPFPFVDIFDGTTTPHNYISFGYEPFSFNNDVINNVWSITDNFNYYAGKHTLTAGITYEQQLVGNMFMPGAQSYYAYNSLSDFMNNKAPMYYSYAYSMVPGKKAVYSAELRYGQAGVYAQDEIKVTPKLKVTLGLRADRPVYVEKALENPAITALTFPDKNGNPAHYNGQWPTPRVQLSPRIGARWDVNGDKSLIIRGSTGIFNGMAPFVWLTNMPTNSGMYQNSVALRNTNPDEAAILAGMTFNPNVDGYANMFPPVAGASIPSNIVLVDKNFKFPQVFRTDIAVDKNLGNGFSLTLEALLTKDINAIRMRNANLKNPTGAAAGPDTRPRYVSTSPSDRSIYPGISSAIVVENTSKGYSYTMTAQLAKSFSKGFYGSLAYTYTAAKDVTGNSGSQATSIWNSNATVGNSNALELNPSSSVARHRVISVISYRHEYLNHASTTLSLIYQGTPGGNITYRINGDMNGDGNNQDLMFIPEKASDLTFEPYSVTVNGMTFNYTAEQQAAALESFIKASPYLSKHRGEYAQRNAAVSPWSNDLTARIMQEFFVKAGKRKHTLQITADFNNFANLLNRYWPGGQQTTTSQPLAFRSYNAAGVPVYRMQNTNGVLYTSPFQNVVGSGGTWSMQLGVRYIF